MTRTPESNGRPTPLGQLALIGLLNLDIDPPFIRTYANDAHQPRRERFFPQYSETFLPSSFNAGPNVREQLRFMLKHEAYDMGVMLAVMQAIPPDELTRWVEDEPTGAYSRRAWFLYEYLTGQRLPLPDATMGNYVPALDPNRHLTASPENSPRHRIRNNLIGSPDLVVSVRNTPVLRELIDLNLADQARQLLSAHDAQTLARASTYLYTKETRSTYALEGETPTPDRAEGFVQLLRQAATFDPDSKEELVALQRAIVDVRYADTDYRINQNYVGESTHGGEIVHYISPKPEDVPTLMRGWQALTRQLSTDPHVDPVVAAACSAFTFVLIHPFEDGNGRIHRFLIHHLLTRRNFTPDAVIFPVSVSILRKKTAYDTVLETFSRPLLRHLRYDLDDLAQLTVHGDTGPRYRALDATLFAEFLYACVQDTLNRDLPEELRWLVRYDQVQEAVTRAVQMPDRRARLLTQFIISNGGTLSKSKRQQFPELTDDELEKMYGFIAAGEARD